MRERPAAQVPLCGARVPGLRLDRSPHPVAPAQAQGGLAAWVRAQWSLCLSGRCQLACSPGTGWSCLRSSGLPPLSWLGPGISSTPPPPPPSQGPPQTVHPGRPEVRAQPALPGPTSSPQSRPRTIPLPASCLCSHSPWHLPLPQLSVPAHHNVSGSLVLRTLGHCWLCPEEQRYQALGWSGGLGSRACLSLGSSLVSAGDQLIMASAPGCGTGQLQDQSQSLPARGRLWCLLGTGQS